MIIQDRAMMAHKPMAALAAEAAQAFRAGLPRLERLRRYYLGRHDILSRQRTEGLPNARMAHGFPRYIAQVSAGWLLGEGARYQAKDDPEGLAAFLALNEACQAAQVDSSLARQQAVYGRAVSLCYQGEGGRCRLAALDPRSAFVVYDDTVEQQPLYGLLMQPGREGGGRLTCYTRDRVLSYAADSGMAPGRLIHSSPHHFGRVPMTEYLNDLEAHGDFEDVLPLIDAYDLLNSDRLNDRAQFADALLVLTGVMGIGTQEHPEDSRQAARRLREDRTLALPDADAKAEWLLKNPQEQDIDVLRRALSEDIHKFSLTPDFLDERFAGRLTSLAIRYKLFGLEQKTRLKEQLMIAGLRERARLMAHYLRASGQPAPDAERLQIRLKRPLMDLPNE